MTNLAYQSLLDVPLNNPELELIYFGDPGIPTVPYVMQDERKMAQTAVGLLVQQMESHYAPKHETIPVKLIVPDSSR